MISRWLVAPLRVASPVMDFEIIAGTPRGGGQDRTARAFASVLGGEATITAVIVAGGEATVSFATAVTDG